MPSDREAVRESGEKLKIARGKSGKQVIIAASRKRHRAGLSERRE
jgi:hypothetical protein